MLVSPALSADVHAKLCERTTNPHANTFSLTRSPTHSPRPPTTDGQTFIRLNQLTTDTGAYSDLAVLGVNTQTPGQETFDVGVFYEGESDTMVFARIRIDVCDLVKNSQTAQQMAAAVRAPGAV